MLWIEAVRQLSSNLGEPFALEFVWRNLHELTKLQWLNLQKEIISETEWTELKSIAQRLENDEPPQYIVGWARFRSYCFGFSAAEDAVENYGSGYFRSRS